MANHVEQLVVAPWCRVDCCSVRGNGSTYRYKAHYTISHATPNPDTKNPDESVRRQA